MFVCKKNNLIKYIDLLKDLIETYFIIIEIGISISLKMIPGIFFCVGFFCSTFVFLSV